MGYLQGDLSVIKKAAINAFIENTTDLIFVKDTDLTYIFASDSFAKMVGLNSGEDVVGKKDTDIFEKALAQRYYTDDKKVLEAGKNQMKFMEPMRSDDGHMRYSSTSKYILKDEEQNVIGLMGVSRDITGEYLARQHHQQELKYLFELPEDTYAAVYLDVDEWRIIIQRRQNISDSSLEMCDTLEQLTKAAVNAIVDTNCMAAEFYNSFTEKNLWEIYRSGRRNIVMEYKRNMPDGSQRWVENEVWFMMNPDNGHLCLMLIARDIDIKKRREKELARSAKTDEMTGVFNRAYTMKTIEKILSIGTGKHALMMIDLDNFKSLNDTHGHQAGDEFLIAFAKMLKACFREGDIVGRIGGDEFFVLMKDFVDRDAVMKKADDLIREGRELCKKHPELPLSLSVGISMYPYDGDVLNELYGKADEALYIAKRAGKDRYVFCE